MTGTHNNAMTSRFEVVTDRFPFQARLDVWVGDWLTGEFRELHTYVPGDAPATIAEREALAAEIVARMTQHRDSLPEFYDFDRDCFVYEDGEPA